MYLYFKRGFIVSSLLLLGACNSGSQGTESVEETGHHQEAGHHHEGDEIKEAMLTQQQFDALRMEIDSLRHRNMSGFVEANGQLEVPPQNEASVTAVIGGNVVAIEVIEGEPVKEGQTLAYISHPDIVRLQTDFLNAHNQLQFEEKEFERQRKLYEAGVGSGATFQRAEAEHKTSQGLTNGLRAQIKLLHLNPEQILQGEIYNRIPLHSPISGAVEQVNVKTGQYVQAQTNMFGIVNTEHVHADLLVFEEDVAKVEVGQQVLFTVKSRPSQEVGATIISVGKTFEQDPKALHVHAEIDGHSEGLIPGMYIRGRILTDSTKATAFPESAIGREGNSYFVFTAEPEGEAWSFKPVEIRPGASSTGWTAVEFLQPLPSRVQFAYNNAYYLMAEMNKGEGGHSH